MAGEAQGVQQVSGCGDGAGAYMHPCREDRFLKCSEEMACRSVSYNDALSLMLQFLHDCRPPQNCL